MCQSYWVAEEQRALLTCAESLTVWGGGVFYTDVTVEELNCVEVINIIADSIFVFKLSQSKNSALDGGKKQCWEISKNSCQDSILYYAKRNEIPSSLKMANTSNLQIHSEK